MKEINPGKQSDYQFISWYEDSDFNTEFDFTTKIFDNITLYPKFRQLYCTFTTGTSTLS
ncbi:InlB B-repeat-containing protein [bacterium]|nr:InlB B-repeat-containing protein [bacterium]